VQDSWMLLPPAILWSCSQGWPASITIAKNFVTVEEPTVVVASRLYRPSGQFHMRTVATDNV
jgi:hypothetical protein